ncbi:conserved hypothetical protein, cofD-related [Arcanobacterium phocae]|uniref:Putative gluconeogenesis factor n=1 Tax=Arcanobacterium phocae TaxID=131112 RepID=A0A1H2LJ86_9ACTO|nr:uridine diphosphate-N-acetylglucosamine-binding protein YvcK [Arcanobacterium phocae]SDU80969.1 conserved hypothetical protein, cofD-related [Arcanobacterium phocae]
MAIYNDGPTRGPKVVALGGGHGLYATLSALRILTPRITAVVTVADDGGSSGRIREEMDVLPPGDLRMALAALCDDTEWGQTWRDVLQYRFESEGPLGGHAVGNLLIVATWHLLHDQLDGLDLVGRLLGIHGRVVPMSTAPLQIEADVRDDSGLTTCIRGQAAVAKAHACVERVGLLPSNPPAHPAALEAIEEADWIIFGPGSWFTSIIPHLLVPEIYSALCRTKAKKILVMNLAPDAETPHLLPSELIASFKKYAPDFTIDRVIVDPTSATSDTALSSQAYGLGAEPFYYHVAKNGNPEVHDPLFLATAFREVIDSSPQ